MLLEDIDNMMLGALGTGDLTPDYSCCIKVPDEVLGSTLLDD